MQPSTPSLTHTHTRAPFRLLQGHLDSALAATLQSQSPVALSVCLHAYAAIARPQVPPWLQRPLPLPSALCPCLGRWLPSDLHAPSGLPAAFQGPIL